MNYLTALVLFLSWFVIGYVHVILLNYLYLKNMFLKPRNINEVNKVTFFFGPIGLIITLVDILMKLLSFLWKPIETSFEKVPEYLFRKSNK